MFNTPVMDIHSLALIPLWVTCTFFLLLISFEASTSLYTEHDDRPEIVYPYTRFVEIKDKCSSVLSLSSELKPDDDRGNRIKKELTFESGDWEQESGGATLMPFDDTSERRSFNDPLSLAELASFYVKDVNPVHLLANIISISGILTIGISRSHAFFEPQQWSPWFDMYPGRAFLDIPFEGVYVESEQHGGERLMCLLGNALLPLSDQHVNELETVKALGGYGYTKQPRYHLVQDDQIILVLKYPKTFTLTKRGIIGEMTSLNGKPSEKYFDKVHISSQMGHNTKYHFGGDGVLQKACNPYPYDDISVDNVVSLSLYKGDQICNYLQKALVHEIFKFTPSWQQMGNSGNGNGNVLGPFVIDSGRKVSADDFFNVRLLVQDFRCEQTIDGSTTTMAQASAVFRLMEFEEDRHVAWERTGLSEMTLSMEGIWKSTHGQLCMVGCIGLTGANSERCNSRICFYVPLTFSLHQRSAIFGTISSIHGLHPSLTFEMVKLPTRFIQDYQRDIQLNWSYSYSKTAEAITFQNKTVSFIHVWKKLIFSFPLLNNESFSSLSHELSFGVPAAPFTSPEDQTIHVLLDVLPLGSLFGHYHPEMNRNRDEFSTMVDGEDDRIAIAGFLRTEGRHFTNLSLSFEGIYDPTIGELYLVGCREMNHAVIENDSSLERGKDCLVEVKVAYPPVNAEWLINRVTISVRSTRTTKDPHYFSPINLINAHIPHDNQVDNIFFQRVVEGTLWVVILTVAIICTRSQLFYITNKMDPSHLSLAMLAIQALSFGIPLASGYGILLQWNLIRSGGKIFFLSNHPGYYLMESAIKVQLMVLSALTVKLTWKVYESRRNQISQSHTPKTYSPMEIKVFLYTAAVHMVGLLVVHIIREVNASDTIPQSSIHGYTSMNTEKASKWVGEICDYGSLVQNLFLLPQVIANILWPVQGRPLRKIYYFGFTVLRLLIHAYDAIRDPITEAFDDKDENHALTLDLHSKFANTVVPVMVILLALVVYKQQRK